jgi:hypothetical protein
MLHDAEYLARSSRLISHEFYNLIRHPANRPHIDNFSCEPGGDFQQFGSDTDVVDGSR